MSKGKKIAAGWEAEIFEWSDGSTPKALKLFFSGREAQAKIERDSMRVIRDAGGPVPEVFGGTIEVDERSGFIMERIFGHNMQKLIDRRNYSKKLAGALGRQVGKLHAEIHQHRGLKLQHNLKEIIALGIMSATAITDPEKEILLKTLSKLPDGDRLCHFDFHPGNIISVHDELVVIDWVNGAVGDPMADVARTQLLMTTGWIGGKLIDTLLSGLTRRLSQRINQYYTEGYFLASEADPGGVDQWRTVIAAARLSEGLPKRQEAYLAAVVREGIDA
jgi:tRNA A-37 threonylcarbamoyl transferase component Bud32